MKSSSNPRIAGLEMEISSLVEKSKLITEVNKKNEKANFFEKIWVEVYS